MDVHMETTDDQAYDSDILDINIPTPTPATTVSTSATDCHVSTTLDKPPSDEALFVSGETEEDESIDELIPVTKWPGNWITPQPDLAIDYENAQLYHILQSARQILNVSIDNDPLTNDKASSASKRRQNLFNLGKPCEKRKATLSVSLPSESAKELQAPSPDIQRIPRQRPKTSHSKSPPPKSKHRRNLQSATEQRKSLNLSSQHLPKYKRPDINKIKREYRQPWNEQGDLRKKDTRYLEVHYDSCLPPIEDEDLRLRPMRFSHNHRHGYHWELRYLIEEEKPKKKLKKVERIWENEFQMFKLQKMLDKQLNLRDTQTGSEEMDHRLS